MSYARSIKKLDKLYATLPKLECKGLCVHSCVDIIGLSGLERTRLHQINDRPRQGPVCPMLQNCKCLGYEARPMICRLWGIAKEMPCPHGCVLERVIEKLEGNRLLAAAEAIGGPHVFL